MCIRYICILNVCLFVLIYGASTLIEFCNPRALHSLLIEPGTGHVNPNRHTRSKQRRSSKIQTSPTLNRTKPKKSSPLPPLHTCVSLLNLHPSHRCWLVFGWTPPPSPIGHPSKIPRTQGNHPSWVVARHGVSSNPPPPSDFTIRGYLIVFLPHKSKNGKMRAKRAPCEQISI